MEEGLQRQLEESSVFVKSRVKEIPEIAIVLGSGLGPLAEMLDKPVVIPYGEIPHFAKSTVEGHAGELLIGKLGGKPVICMNGRFHFYEGYPMEVVTYPFKLFKALGVKYLLLSNAVGGINGDFSAGDLMIIQDHLNLMGTNPLIGPNLDSLGPRFPDMSSAYSKRLAAIAHQGSQKLGANLKQGVYVALTGPTYETPAEIQMLKKLGADAVGMSTVPELQAADQLGIDAVGISTITNYAAGILDQPLTHNEVIETANRTKDDFAKLIGATIDNIGKLL